MYVSENKKALEISLAIIAGHNNNPGCGVRGCGRICPCMVS